MEKIPVIVINWNGFDDTVECIESLLVQSFKNFIIYLIDNDSRHDEFEKLQAKYGNNQHIVLMKNSTNLGFTIAHNQLFEILMKSDAEYVALINNDAVADSNWLEQLYSKAELEKADMVASMMINYQNHTLTDSAGLFLLSSGEILPIGHDAQIDSLPKKLRAISACGGACLYRLSMLKNIGIFDPYFSTGYEDAELGLRAFIAGKKIVLAENAIVFHKMSRSVTKIFNRDKAQKIQEDINYTCLKLMPTGVIVINSIFNIPRWIIIMLIHLITLRFRFVAIQLGALKRTMGDLKTIILKRKEFSKQRKTSTLEILKAQTFFLSHDLKRFIHLIVKHQKNQFEKY